MFDSLSRFLGLQQHRGCMGSQLPSEAFAWETSKNHSVVTRCRSGRSSGGSGDLHSFLGQWWESTKKRACLLV